VNPKTESLGRIWERIPENGKRTGIETVQSSCTHIKPSRELVTDLKFIRGVSTIQVTINEGERRLIVDTRSSLSLIQSDIAGGNSAEVDVTPVGVTGVYLCIEEKQQVEISQHDCIFRHPFYVRQLQTDAHGMVGADLLVKMKASLDVDCRTFVIRRPVVRHETIPTRIVAVHMTSRQASNVAFPVFTYSGGPKLGREAPKRRGAVVAGRKPT
jgi:hypothetical protein